MLLARVATLPWRFVSGVRKADLRERFEVGLKLRDDICWRANGQRYEQGAISRKCRTTQEERTNPQFAASTKAVGVGRSREVWRGPGVSLLWSRICGVPEEVADLYGGVFRRADRHDRNTNFFLPGEEV